MDIRLIAIDLDGTLLNSSNMVSEANIQAVRRARERGLEVVLISARPLFGITAALDSLGLAGPVVAYNGAYIVDTHTQEVLLDLRMSATDLRAAVDIVRQHGLYTGYYAGMRWMAEKECDELLLEQRSLGRQPEMVDLAGEELPPASKLIVISLSDRPLLERCHAQMRARLPHLNVHFSAQICFEVCHPGATKGAALAFLARRAGLPAEAVMAIGDNCNDLDMLAYAGLSVAVGNAPSDVQAAADWVVAPHDQNGVAQAITRLLDGE
jgi:hypothetical protein